MNPRPYKTTVTRIGKVLSPNNPKYASEDSKPSNGTKGKRILTNLRDHATSGKDFAVAVPQSDRVTRAGTKLGTSSDKTAYHAKIKEAEALTCSTAYMEAYI